MDEALESIVLFVYIMVFVTRLQWNSLVLEAILATWIVSTSAIIFLFATIDSYIVIYYNLLYIAKIWYATTDFDDYHEQQNHLRLISDSLTTIIDDDCDEAVAHETLDNDGTCNVYATLEGIYKILIDLYIFFLIGLITRSFKLFVIIMYKKGL